MKSTLKYFIKSLFLSLLAFIVSILIGFAFSCEPALDILLYGILVGTVTIVPVYVLLGFAAIRLYDKFPWVGNYIFILLLVGIAANTFFLQLQGWNFYLLYAFILSGFIQFQIRLAKV